MPTTPAPGPTAKSQCKHYGWKSFSTPSFKNQGRCIAWFNHRDGKRADDRHAGHHHRTH